MAKATVSPVSGHKYQVEVASGSHTIICDQPTSVGGSDGGMGPKELLAGSLAACAVQTIQMFTQSKGWDITELSVTVTISKSGRQNVVDEEIEVKGNLSQTELDDIKRKAENCPVMKLFTGTKTVNATITHKQ